MLRTFFHITALLLLCGPALGKPAKTAPRVSAPTISTTSSAPEYQAAETRLAQFITALQLDRRERAARLLSHRVGPAARRALIEGRWLRRSGAQNSDFTQVLFLPDLQIRTRQVFRDSVRLAVFPRPPRGKKEKRITGLVEVRMRKEYGKWWVDLRPSEKLAGAR
jgi:hypothetical protein